MLGFARSVLNHELRPALRLQQCRACKSQAAIDTKNDPETKSNNTQPESPVSLDVRFKYPEFLPHPWQPWRNFIREKLERSDMLKRRSHIDIPEFYVGSVLAVTSSNINAPTKTTRFVGICILREGTGLNARFMLRNVIDNQGVDISFDLYDPKLQKIEVLRLEKRLDSDLLYLRDAELQYSTFPEDMEPEFLAEGASIPVNSIKVKLRARPHRVRYESKDYLGIQPFESSARRLSRAVNKTQRRPTKYDLMWHYRESIPEEEQREIYAEICSEIQKNEIMKRKIKRRSQFVPPSKTN